MLVLALLGLGLSLAIFSLLAGGLSFANRTYAQLWLVVCLVVIVGLLVASLAARLLEVLGERRRGAAGARLHVRLVMLFSVVAVIPAVTVAVFATVFFHFGIQAWFNDRVRTALSEAQAVSMGYLQEHNNNIRGDALSMAAVLADAGTVAVTNPDVLNDELGRQAFTRGLTEAVIYDSLTRKVVAYAGFGSPMGVKLPPGSVTAMTNNGNVAILDSPDENSVRAVVQLDPLAAGLPPLMLEITRPVDPTILAHTHRTESVVADYDRLDQNRARLQLTFVMIFLLVTVLVLSAAILFGLLLANQIARPIGLLILAAERVRSGDLAVRVPEREADDEVAGLSRAFNRMTDQLAAQRAELLSAYGQINERRRFTESVLSGVSAGVIGLDSGQRVELPNRAASELLGQDLEAAIGHELEALAPDFGPLLRQAQAAPLRVHTAEVQSGEGPSRRVFLVRVSPDGGAGVTDGYVVTFDDITELQSAQRKAAWADVARRIAHEIKNPLTPIQLSAERLKRKFLPQITTDAETFSQCAELIVRHVGDIGRMVDEFSAFARMPQPVMKPEDVGRIAREALILQRSAHPEIDWRVTIPHNGPVAVCDRRLIGQALTNLLQNAADSIAMVPAEDAAAQPGWRGTIWLEVSEATAQDGRPELRIAVADDGIGLPDVDRARLTEPYVTHKPKGTGLGLAIVKKIMEDHEGAVCLEDRATTASRQAGGWLRDDPLTQPGVTTMAGAALVPATTLLRRPAEQRGARAILVLPLRVADGA
ncbi:PAS domain-containing sensor histidine kinase [Endobacter medicaginis]|nr:PAS domain-containing sensor histidine kinase [Endobacter medicaginis]MCX5476799.1 PAS domain-containing sensor histidine kinase [Endobacter medicaginis]NVN30318.1 PAS domain-containing sensor histidine kinase [Endobacter medicaginis]